MVGRACVDGVKFLRQQASRHKTVTERFCYHTYVRTRAVNGSSARIPISPGQTFGAVMSRGERAQQEDAYSCACVSLPCDQLRQAVIDATPRGVSRNPWFGWSCEEAGGSDIGGQLAWFACFDGHGGQSVSKRLAEILHEVFELAEPDMITDTVQYMRSLGGYFRRYNGGPLERWVDQEILARSTSKKEANTKLETSQRYQSLAELANSSQSKNQPEDSGPIYHALDHTRRIPPPDTMRGKQMTIRERATLAWLMDSEYDGAGSTASVVLLHSLDKPASPWYSSQYVSLTTIHLGDTRLLLCPVNDGRALPLTTFHHPDDPAESERLSRLGAGLVTDSFGENRWLGTLANTRAFGDTDAKRYGVTPEPDISTHILRGSEFAFVIGFSDGISDVADDQEILDLCRGAKHPQDAAKRVLRYAENLGSPDNATVLCVPLAGWGNVQGEDITKDRRKERLSKVDIFRDRRK